LKLHAGNLAKIVEFISNNLGQHHFGKWTCLVIEGANNKWEIEYFQVEDKHMNYAHSGYQFFVYKCA